MVVATVLEFMKSLGCLPFLKSSKAFPAFPGRVYSAPWDAAPWKPKGSAPAGWRVPGEGTHPHWVLQTGWREGSAGGFCLPVPSTWGTVWAPIPLLFAPRWPREPGDPPNAAPLSPAAAQLNSWIQSKVSEQQLQLHGHNCLDTDCLLEAEIIIAFKANMLGKEGADTGGKGPRNQ